MFHQEVGGKIKKNKQGKSHSGPYVVQWASLALRIRLTKNVCDPDKRHQIPDHRWHTFLLYFTRLAACSFFFLLPLASPDSRDISANGHSNEHLINRTKMISIKMWTLWCLISRIGRFKAQISWHNEFLVKLKWNQANILSPLFPCLCMNEFVSSETRKVAWNEHWATWTELNNLNIKLFAKCEDVLRYGLLEFRRCHHFSDHNF